MCAPWANDHAQVICRRLICCTYGKTLKERMLWCAYVFIFEFDLTAVFKHCNKILIEILHVRLITEALIDEDVWKHSSVFLV